MTLVSTRPTIPSLVAGVVGGPVRGSWWSHPRGGDIYAVASALEGAPDVLTAKLVDGKVAFVHRRLWPALVRVVTDAGWRRARSADLAAPAAALLALVESRGEVHADDAVAALGDRKAFAAARKPLEARALVHAAAEHTERGHHAAVLTAWSRWAPAAVARAGRGLGLDDAMAALAAAGIDLAAPARARRR